MALANFAHTGAYPASAKLAAIPLAYVQRTFLNTHAENVNREVENETAKHP